MGRSGLAGRKIIGVWRAEMMESRGLAGVNEAPQGFSRVAWFSSTPVLS
jgi:hypothetical protein